MVYSVNTDQNNKIFTSSFWANLFKSKPTKTELENLLLSIPPFENFSKSALKNFIQLIHHRSYAANEIIFAQGDPGIAIYIIQEGLIKIAKDDNQGNQYLLAEFTRGDFFGELALLDNDVRSASAIAVKDSKIAVIFKPDLDYFIRKNPTKGIEIISGIAKIISVRLRKLDNEMMKVIFNSQSKEGGENV